MKTVIHLLFVYLLSITLACNNDKAVNDLSNDQIDDNSQQDPKFRFPLDDYRVIQNFANSNDNFGGKYHSAEDAFADAGTPVYSIADGVVSYSGPMGGYGWLVIIDHPSKNVYSLYGHVSTASNKVSIDENVKSGDIIAYIADDNEDGSGPPDGSGPYVYWGPHLHFSVRNGKKSDYPDSGDNRWMAGYTFENPSTLGWVNPSGFINDNQ